MALAPVTIDSVISNHSNSGKWILNQNLEFDFLPSNALPILVDPETGNNVGVLIEPASVNYYEDSKGMSLGFTLDSGVTREEKSAPYNFTEGTHVLLFDENVIKKKAT